ncbi:MAG TPA: Maf family nucleotide pyrophosphatase [Ferruginibacter sp.]|nr:Maf family nucleotide pyrophosphatase [Ferruginibacter sp.]
MSPSNYNNSKAPFRGLGVSIILASQSPRRKQLLEWAEVSFDIIVKETDESYPTNLSVEEIAIHIARNKALAVKQSNLVSVPILAADTIVVVDNDVIGKPKDREDAINILTRLSGRQHFVITGVVILHGDKEIAFADKTTVVFHELTKTQIGFYIDKYKPYDKAGAYAIQEWIGVVGIKSVQGDFYNVMGLPVSRVVRALTEMQNQK